MTISGWNAKATPKGFAVLLAMMMALSVALVGATIAAAAPPSVAVDLDQCRNGALVTSGTQTFNPCITTGSGASGWVNGNAGASNAHFAEGESISYRSRLTNLKAADNVVLIMGYDVIHNGHDAIDYLTDKNRWQLPETTVAATPDEPCSGVSGCTTLAPDSLIAIDQPETNLQIDTTKTLANGCQTNGSGATQQPLTSFNAVATAGQANMELFGGTDGSFAYVGPLPVLTDKNGDQEQQVEVTFTATRANPVLAWGGHIASRLDWGCLGSIRSASGISGSPYHMRIKSATINGIPVSLGNQDRSLSASAVVFLQSTLTTIPTASATYSATVGDSLNVGVSTAGGTADFYLYNNLTDCQANTTANAVWTWPGVTVTNGATAAADVTHTFTGLTAAVTYYWYVHYNGDSSSSPPVTSGNSVCTESATFTAPTASASGS
jgi:hypothetical protein